MLSSRLAQMAATNKAPDSIHLEAYGGLSHLKDAGLHDAALAGGAFEGAAQEHSMGVWQGLKTYKRAAFWSIRKLSQLKLGTVYCSKHF